MVCVLFLFCLFAASASAYKIVSVSIIFVVVDEKVPGVFQTLGVDELWPVRCLLFHSVGGWEQVLGNPHRAASWEPFLAGHGGADTLESS